jgi:iron complex transport system substrate-binding protein
VRAPLHRAFALVLALGASVHAAAPPRVASVNLSADEVLLEILPPGQLVAVTRWVDDASMSSAAGRVPPGIFRLQKADLEQLLALKPDLVVLSEYTDADFQRLLERSGARVHRMGGLRSLAGVRQALLDLGRVVGQDRAASRLVERYDATLSDLAHRLQGAPRPRLLYWSGDMTAGADTAIGALIEGAGATNVGRELGVVGIAAPGAERAFASDPDVVLVTDWPGAREAVTAHPLLSQLRAAREGRVVVMPNRLVVALSQHTADAAWWLAARLHPERVPETRP